MIPAPGQLHNRGQAAHLDRRGTVGRVAVAELILMVTAPRPQGAVRLESDVMLLAAHHGDDSVQIARSAGSQHLHRQRAVGRGSVPQLPMRVQAPGPDRAVGFQGDRFARSTPDGSGRPVCRVPLRVESDIAGAHREGFADGISSARSVGRGVPSGKTEARLEEIAEVA